MHFSVVFPSLLALLDVSVFAGAAPVPVRASLLNNAASFGDQNLPYDGEGQVPLSAPTPYTPPLPSPPRVVPSTSYVPPPLPSPTRVVTPSSNSSRPMKFMLPAWVTAPYPKSLKSEDRDVFGSTLQGITLAKKHSSMGNNNAGVYGVASFDSSFAQIFPPSIAQKVDPSRLLVKILKNIDDDMIAEVKALKVVGQFVASGMLKLPTGKSNERGRKRRVGVKSIEANSDDLFELKPVIVMLKMEGLPLTSIPEFSENDIATKRRMMGDTLDMMCSRVGKLALEHRFVHRDNIIGNVLVIANGTEVVDVNIIDWGAKYLSSIRDDVTEDDLMEWCHRRWPVYVWEAGL